MTAPTFLGLTSTPYGMFVAWSDGRIAEVLDRDGAVTLRPYAHADHAALWPEPVIRDDALPSEALFGFMGWLTCRDEVAGPFSARHNAAEAAKLVAEFCKSQDFISPRDDFPKRLKDYPDPLPTRAD